MKDCILISYHLSACSSSATSGRDLQIKLVKSIYKRMYVHGHIVTSAKATPVGLANRARWVCGAVHWPAGCRRAGHAGWLRYVYNKVPMNMMSYQFLTTIVVHGHAHKNPCVAVCHYVMYKGWGIHGHHSTGIPGSLWVLYCRIIQVGHCT